MTNVRKHAPSALLTISLDGGPDDGVLLVLRNPLLGFARTTTPGAGPDLGITERVALGGGRLEYGVREAHPELRAQLPWAG